MWSPYITRETTDESKMRSFLLMRVACIQILASSLKSAFAMPSLPFSSHQQLSRCSSEICQRKKPLQVIHVPSGFGIANLHWTSRHSALSNSSACSCPVPLEKRLIPSFTAELPQAFLRTARCWLQIPAEACLSMPKPCLEFVAIACASMLSQTRAQEVSVHQFTAADNHGFFSWSAGNTCVLVPP